VAHASATQERILPLMIPRRAETVHSFLAVIALVQLAPTEPRL
jgi:hypothetical protein